MIARASAACLLLMALACVAVADEPAADGWRRYAPSDWLATIEVRDLERLEPGLRALAEPWGTPPPPIAAVVSGILPADTLASRPWAAAFAESKKGPPIGVLFVPTDDFSALCDALQADPAGDIAIVTLFGYDLALEECDGWARVSLLDQEIASEPIDPDATPKQPVEGNLRVRASAHGLRAAADHLAELRRARIAFNRGRIKPWTRAPRSLGEAMERLAPYWPVVKQLAAYEEPITVDFSLGDEALTATIVAPVQQPAQHADHAPPLLPAAKPIAVSRIPGQPAPIVIDLGLAWMRSRPQDHDAVEFPARKWRAYADSQRRMLALNRGTTEVYHLPQPGQPVSANQQNRFGWDGDSESLGRSLRDVTTSWNQLINATKTRSRLLAELSPGEASGTWTITSDLFAGVGLASTPELEALFDRYFGNGGKMISEFAQTEDGSWLYSMHESYQPKPPETVGQQDSARPHLQPDVLLDATLWLDRLIAWHQQVDGIDKQKDRGRRVRPPMAESPPAQFTLVGGETLRAEARLPLSTYGALVRFWMSEPQPVEAIE